MRAQHAVVSCVALTHGFRAPSKRAMHPWRTCCAVAFISKASLIAERAQGAGIIVWTFRLSGAVETGWAIEGERRSVRAEASCRARFAHAGPS